jgi:KTSC domain
MNTPRNEGLPWDRIIAGVLATLFVLMFVPGIPDLFIGTVKPTKARELVQVQYFGPVDLAPMVCKWTPESTFINRLCFDAEREYAVVSLNGTYYHYCGIPPEVIHGWYESASLGRYYNVIIKGRFPCS